VDMSARLGRMLAYRQKTLKRLDSLLADSLTVLRAEKRTGWRGVRGTAA
jgi:hypothetical protein